ncbi:F-box only protein 5-like [Periplaneta americana]|uniref:F-box only protein 5-like n=1 Tax=Periplaneta americana TaxID=6978 RepID=UPI0037E9B6D2
MFDEVKMAWITPARSMHLSGETMETDDSGCVMNTPNSIGSLGSEQRRRNTLLQECECKYRTPISSTPNLDAVVIHLSSCSKRKVLNGRIEVLQVPGSSVSNIGAEDSSPSIISPFQTRDRGHFITYDEMEVDEQETDSLWRTESAITFEKLSGKCEKPPPNDLKAVSKLSESSDSSLDHSSEISSQDSGIGSQDSISSFQSQVEITVSDKYKMFKRNILMKQSVIYKNVEAYTPQLRPRASQKRPCQIGREKVDFFSLLGVQTDHTVIIKAILSYLEPVDLTAIAVVSKAWNRLCLADSSAYRRVQQYLEQKQRNKENCISLQVNKTDSAPISNQPRIFLRRIENISTEKSNEVPCSTPSPPTSPSKRRFLQFYKAGQNLENGKMLAPCPRCSLPSQIDGTSNEGQCTRVGCLYLFCCNCRCESHGATPCPSSISFPRPRKRIGSIGSKSSKKNLRRL